MFEPRPLQNSARHFAMDNADLVDKNISDDEFSTPKTVTEAVGRRCLFQTPETMVGLFPMILKFFGALNQLYALLLEATSGLMPCCSKVKIVMMLGGNRT